MSCVNCGGNNGNPLQHSCLEKSHGPRSRSGYSPWGHNESDTTERTCPLCELLGRNSWKFVPGFLQAPLVPLPCADFVLGPSVAINHSHEYVCMSCVSSWGTSDSGGGLGSPRYNNCTKVNFLLEEFFQVSLNSHIMDLEHLEQTEWYSGQASTKNNFFFSQKDLSLWSLASLNIGF